MHCPFTTLSTSQTQDAIAAKLGGPLAHEAANLLADLGAQLETAADTRPINLDLSGISSYTPNGVAALLALQQSTVARGAALDVLAPDVETAVALESAGVERVRTFS